MAELIQKQDTLNEGREKINAAITDAEQAKVTADGADTKATQALANSESTQTQLDTIVINGDSSVEAAQARVDEKGVPHPTLKVRIDDGFEKTASQLNDTMSQTEFDSWVATLLDGGPSIFFDSYSQLVAEYPNGAAGVALIRETDPARIYVWDGQEWAYFGEYQGIEIKNETVTKAKLSLDLQGFIDDWQSVLTNENEPWEVV